VASENTPALSRRALRERRDTGAESAGFGDVTGIFGSVTGSAPAAAPAPASASASADSTTTAPATLGAEGTTTAVLPVVADDPVGSETTVDTLDPGMLAAPAGPVTPAEGAVDAAPGGGAASRAALTWVDAGTVAAPRPRGGIDQATSPYIPVEADLLADRPRRSPLRASVLVPIGIGLSLVGAYAATTLLWPLHAVAPTVEAVAVQPTAAPAAAPAWPTEGSAAVSVTGFDGTLASSDESGSIASITKVVTALVVLDEMPLDVGEQGPEYRFFYGDMVDYWNYRARGESALDVPVDGTLTQYQMLEGMLIGSANNYARRLADDLWPSDAVFADAATQWMSVHGVPGIQITEPTGIDRDNRANAAALIPLAQKALANPVVAEIVAKRSVEIPGAGLVENTNELLADPGVLGIKTGTLDEFSLIAAKDVVIGDTTVRLYASVLGQPDDEARVAATRALFAGLEADLQVEPSVTAGTVVGTVTTAWGERVAIVTSDDAGVVLWNGAAPTAAPTYALDESRMQGDEVGSLTIDGPVDAATVALELTADIEPPSAWWRLTHPLELFGLTG
jgi:D-alanyl-D-alanine carboxypeptidase (penicillin-binding protein 5/6)